MLKDQLEQAVEKMRGELKVDPAVLSLLWFNEENWAIQYNGERYVPKDFNNEEFLSKVVSGKEKTLNERIKDKRIKEERKQKSLEGEVDEGKKEGDEVKTVDSIEPNLENVENSVSKEESPPKEGEELKVDKDTEKKEETPVEPKIEATEPPVEPPVEVPEEKPKLEIPLGIKKRGRPRKT